MSEKSKNRIVFTFKVIVGVLTLSYLLYTVKLQKWSQLLVRLNLPAFVFGTFLFLVGVFLSAFKWKKIIERFTDISYGKLVKFYFIGYYFNHFLPSNIGGDAVRGAYLKKESSLSLSFAYSTIFLERLLGLAAVFSLLIVGLGLNYSYIVGQPLILFIFFSLVFGLVCGGGVFLVFQNKELLLNKIPYLKEVDLDNLKDVFRAKKFFWGLMFLISILFQLLVIGGVYFLLSSLGVRISFLVILFVKPAVTIISLAPLSLNGIGIAEAGYVGLLALFGVSQSPALLLALLVRGVKIFISLPGFLFFLDSENSYVKEN